MPRPLASSRGGREGGRHRPPRRTPRGRRGRDRRAGRRRGHVRRRSRPGGRRRGEGRVRRARRRRRERGTGVRWRRRGRRRRALAADARREPDGGVLAGASRHPVAGRTGWRLDRPRLERLGARQRHGRRGVRDVEGGDARARAVDRRRLRAERHPGERPLPRLGRDADGRPVDGDADDPAPHLAGRRVSPGDPAHPPAATRHRGRDRGLLPVPRERRVVDRDGTTLVADGGGLAVDLTEVAWQQEGP